MERRKPFIFKREMVAGVTDDLRAMSRRKAAQEDATQTRKD